MICGECVNVLRLENSQHFVNSHVFQYKNLSAFRQNLTSVLFLISDKCYDYDPKRCVAKEEKMRSRGQGGWGSVGLQCTWRRPGARRPGCWQPSLLYNLPARQHMWYAYSAYPPSHFLSPHLWKLEDKKVFRAQLTFTFYRCWIHFHQNIKIFTQ